MNDTPYTTIGDEPVEARIVAWVLGEASGFEVAELERLCAERPELLVFRRRMRALHGLLTEAEAAQADDFWKLPPEKRRALDEICGEEPPRSADPVIEKRVRRSGRRALLAIAACVILTLIIGGGFGAGSGSIKKARKLASGFSTAPTSHSPNGRLETELPPELSEGTPRPILLPGISSSDELTFAGGTNNKPAEEERVAKNEETKQLRQMAKRDVIDPGTPPASSAGASPDASLAKTKEQQKKRAQISPTPDVKRVFAEGSALSYQIPDSDDQFGEMSKLSALSGGGMSGGLGGAGTGKGFGHGDGTLADAGAAGESQRQPRPRVRPEAPGQPSAPTTAPAAQPQAAKQLAAKDRAGRDMLERGQPAPAPKPATSAPAKAGFGTGMGGGSGAAAIDADSSLASGLGDDASPAPGGQGAVAGNLPDRLAGEKSSLAEKQAQTAQAPPVLGALFARRDKSEMDERRDSNGRDGKAGDKTTVSGDTLKVTEAGSSDGAVRSNPALTFEHTQNEDKVRRKLYTAEGNYNLGKFEDAKREYESTLRIDPANAAARKGLEKIAAAKSDSYRAAYDQTRAELLSQADAAWEISPPADEKSKDTGAKFKPENTTEFNFEGKELGQSKGASDSKAKAPQVEIIREFTYPTEYEPPETPQGNKPSADTAALRKAIQDQEQKVEDRRKVLSTIVRTKGIIYKGTDSFYGQSGADEDQDARDALRTYQKLAQERMQLESQIKSMLKYDSDQLMVYAGGIDLPENTVKKLYPEYQEAKRKLEGLKVNGLGDDHPTVRAEKSRIETMKRQLDEGVVNLRATLKAQLDMAENRLKSVEAMKNSTREEAIKRGLDAQDYVDAKKEFEKEQELLQQLKIKLMGAAAAPVPVPPKPDFTKLIEETAAAAEPYSTFSLNISDASFQVAQAALAKGQQPDPAGIKVEQFYNAVDYGDPSPTAGEPVAVAIEQAAHPVIPGRNLVRVALKTAAEGRSAAQPLRLTLLVDQSGSMVREDRHLAMDKALAGLAGLLTKNDLVTVIGFARTPHLLADGWTGDKAAKLTELVNQSASEGGTNLEEALKLAEQVAERRKLAGAQNRIVLFTDGAANLGDADPTRLAARVRALRQKGIAFDIAGIAADELNDELLGDLARNGNGRYYVVGKGADNEFARKLAGAFRPAAENVKVQVHFNPERVGRYKLIGFEKDRLKTEDFRNDAVDAAELAAEEAGVAVYQVEPLPGGSGEIGDVSVRFRDAASGQMVERTWTIPHDAGAPVIDRATPPMQLAVLAMLAAEKLRGGPLAEAIDFKQLAEPRANVKRFYGNTGRVAEVLHMIDSL